MSGDRFCREERRLLEPLSYNEIALTCRKLGDGDSEFLLDVEKKVFKKHRDVEFVRENERGYNKQRVLNLFFKLLDNKTIKTVRLYGIIEEDEVLNGLSRRTKYNVEILIVDNSTHKSIVEKFKSKCNSLKEIRHLDEDKSKNETNWCNLPMEMRQKCIEQMGFVTKMRLRRTSTTEKALVERRKHEFEYVSIERGPDSGSTCDLSGTRVKIRSNFEAIDSISLASSRWRNKKGISKDAFLHNMKFSMIGSVLKFANIRKFYADAGFNFARKPEIASEFAKWGPFSIKECYFFDDWQCTQRFFFKNIGKELEVLELKYLVRYEFEELVKEPMLSVLLNLRQLQYGYTSDNATIDVIQTWIQHDKKVGSRCIGKNLTGYRRDQMEFFAKRFSDRIIDQNDSEIRIRTDNPLNHGLFKVYLGRYNGDTMLVYEVIPASLQSSEYKKEHGWIDVKKDRLLKYGAF